MHEPLSWYDTPLDRTFGSAGRHRAQVSGADDVFEQTTPKRIDPYLSGLARALAAGAGRIPLIP